MSVPDTPENQSKCLCRNCPSFSSVPDLYCSRGKAASFVGRNGCLCGQCNVFDQYSLDGGYYCEMGKAQ